jgi:predicted O-linked N-acetylglucosamine transferase (SPINDLY family)
MSRSGIGTQVRQSSERYGHPRILFLDTFPFNGGTTVSDALWAGLPVLTCVGEAFAARMAGSLLTSVGLPELVNATPADYEAQAIRFGRDRDALRGPRDRLERARHSAALFGTRRFCRHLEAAYAQMWKFAENGEPPRSFGVSALPG